MSCQVSVQQGELQGKSCVSYNGKKYYSFEGIPYARPPVGSLRFRNPQNPESWPGIRDATKPGNKCAQLDLKTMAIQGSEDCLYLNIYTPSLPCEKIEKLPVLFFVHGGRFLVGYGDWYRPDFFITQNVIFVTLNYRLHILGFMCLDLPEAPGNTALKDIAKALEWVNSNIANFNGNSSNITLFGESAGAAALSTFLTSNMTNGLFSKVISQSGNCVADVYIAREDHIAKAKHISSVAGKDLSDTRSLYNFFMELPLEDLVGAYHSVEMGKAPYVVRPYLTPVIEKKFEGMERFLEEYPLDAIKGNRHKKVPNLIGLSMYEGALFIRKNEEEKIIYEKDFNYFVPDYLMLEKNSPKSKKIISKVRNFYFKGKEVDDSTLLQYTNLVSDTFFQRDLVLFPEILSKYQDDVFFYYFSYVGNMNISVMKKLGLEGTTHGDIIQYQIYRENKFGKCSEEDKKIIEFLSEAWCNFAKNGKPTWSNQQIEWTPYKQNSRLCLDINVKKKMIPNPKYGMYKFWMDTCGDLSKL